MRLAKMLGALCVWLFALLGAVGVAEWLDLGARDAWLLIGAVGVLAFFGAFLPVARLAFHRKT